MESDNDVRSSKIGVKSTMKNVITLSEKAADRIKEIMSKDNNKSIGVRVGVKSGGCAGMSYIMEYTKKQIQMMK